MKYFLKKTLLLLLLILLLAIGLELIYDYVYIHANPRNKSEYILQLKNQKIDYIFFGSSRVKNTIDTKLVESLTHKKTLNLGIDGAKLDDILLQLSILLENNVKFEKIFIQIDYSYSYNKYYQIKPVWLPFIHSNKAINDMLKKSDHYFEYKYIPFYRYMVNDYSIGFREFFFTAINTKSKQNFENGFVPLDEDYSVVKFDSSPNIVCYNQFFEKIKQLCLVNKIKVVYFCAPFSPDIKNAAMMQKLKKRVPELVDYSNFFKSTTYFANSNHLNRNGAKIITTDIVNNYILNEQ